MSAGQNGNEVTRLATVVEQALAAGERVAEGEIVEGNESPARAGGVQNSERILNSDVRISREIVATTVQNSPGILNTFPETGNARAVPAPGRVQTPAEFLALPPQALPGKPGPKPLITPEVAQQLCMLMSLGLSRRQAAAYLDISPGTITHAVDRDPALGEELKKAKEMSMIHPELTVIAEARRNWKAAIWYLEYKAKNPQPLGEEEKEERHRQRLAEARRENELTDIFLRSEKPLPEPKPSDGPAKARSRRRSGRK